MLWSDTQRAEYLADALGARAAGTVATVSALDKLYLMDTVRAAIHRVAVSDDSDKMDLFAEFRRYTSRVPEREWERLRRTEALANSRLDSTHPPTAYRLELLRAHPVSEPAVVLQAADSQEIDREFGQVSWGVQKTILEDHIWAIT
jgi:heat shock protein HtpX